MEAANTLRYDMMLERPEALNSFYAKHGKRLLDIAIAFPAVIFTLPINLPIAVITLFDVGRPIIFRQKRPGLNGVSFTIFKFRNMRNMVDEDGYLLPPKDRVTGFGRFVRATSLDELLQFWNILFGSMSVIGPRPLKMSYFERYSERHKVRQLVRPGLECPMHCDIDHERTIHDQLENDVWYVNHIGFKTDLFLMIQLIRMVFDKKLSKKRSVALSGTFMGYRNGIAYSEKITEEERLRQKIKVLQQRQHDMTIHPIIDNRAG
jgi:lipopolysaccharide/colanic/teichoic acid biosynthesis glycosyltransferase